MYIKRNILIILLLFIVDCIVILSINYMIGNDFGETPYGLSENYIILHSDNNIQNNNNGFDFSNFNKDITVIAETTDDSVIGLYDPTMKYYINSTKFINPEELRYFSTEDYAEKHKVGIIVNSIYNKSQNIDLSKINISKIESDYNIDVINIFDIGSRISENIGEQPSLLVVNLFALDYSKITNLYLDSTDNKKLKEAKNELMKFGYKKINIDNEMSIMQSINNSFLGNKYVKFILYSSVFAYLLLLYVLVIYLHKYDKYLCISRSFGATFGSMIKLAYARLFITSILINMISSLFMFVYLEIINKNYMTLLNILKVQSFVTASLMIVFLVKYIVVFKKSRLIMR